MIEGFATSSGTEKYFRKHRKVARRKTPWFAASRLAIGTHLGEMTLEDSYLYRESIEFALKHGVNFIDTAINYRGMRSERDVGLVLKQLIAEEKSLSRDEVVVSTKAGIIPGDIEANLVPSDYLETVLLQNHIIETSDLNIAGHVRHVLNPGYYQFAIEQSRKHLNLNTIDIHYIHNPETSMRCLGPDLFFTQIEKLFAFYEDQILKGHIRFYGMATWDAFLHDPDHPRYISLEKVIQAAESVAGSQHHFRFIQFPCNRNRTDGKTKMNQSVSGHMLPVMQAAKELRVFVTTSAPLDSGRTVEKRNAVESLSEIVKTEGIFAAMVGMKQVQHVENNLEAICCRKGRPGQ